MFKASGLRSSLRQEDSYTRRVSIAIKKLLGSDTPEHINLALGRHGRSISRDVDLCVQSVTQLAATTTGRSTHSSLADHINLAPVESRRVLGEPDRRLFLRPHHQPRTTRSERRKRTHDVSRRVVERVLVDMLLSRQGARLGLLLSARLARRSANETFAVVVARGRREACEENESVACGGQEKENNSRVPFFSSELGRDSSGPRRGVETSL